MEYLFAKEHGLCVRCRSEIAEPGKATCFECAEKMREQKRKIRAGMTEEQKKILREKAAESNRKLYKKRKDAGICVICGRHKATPGMVKCIDCRLKTNRRRRKEIQRIERLEYGLCYVCGKPVCEASGKLCQEHYNMFHEQAKQLNANPSEGMLKAREDYVKRYREFKRSIYGRGDGNGQEN